MKRFFKKIDPLFKFIFNKYHTKSRLYTYGNIAVLVHPDVFPPHFTISTKILLDYIKPLHLKNKSVLELGCGSGIISLFAASKGAQVTASDINMTALNTLNEAAKKNNLQVNTVYSNLFDALQNQTFNYIIINPPYYPKNPKNDKEKAWFCGENFEYFEALFSQLVSRAITSEIFMILSNDCDLEKIKSLALKNSLVLNCIYTKKRVFETNFIFKIKYYSKSNT